VLQCCVRAREQHACNLIYCSISVAESPSCHEWHRLLCWLLLPSHSSPSFPSSSALNISAFFFAKKRTKNQTLLAVKDGESGTSDKKGKGERAPQQAHLMKCERESRVGRRSEAALHGDGSTITHHHTPTQHTSSHMFTHHQNIIIISSKHHHASSQHHRNFIIHHHTQPHIIIHRHKRQGLGHGGRT
jgi:hypothetical protein